AELKAQLDTTNAKLDGIQRTLDRLTELLEGKRDAKGFRIESDPGAVEEIKRLKNQLADLQKQMDTMKSSTSLRPGATITNRGTVRVVNDYPVEISIVINGRSYRVAANTTTNVDVPVGEFTYQLLQSGASEVRSRIAEKEVVTLRVK